MTALKHKRKIMAIIATALIVGAITTVIVTQPDRAVKKQATGFLTAFYTATGEDVQALLQVTQEDVQAFFETGQDEALMSLDHRQAWLLERYDTYLTSACFDRLAANRTLDATLMLADTAHCDVKPQSIRLIQRTKDGDTYKCLYAVEVTQYNRVSGEPMRSFEAKVDLDFVREANDWKIQAVRLVD